LARSLQVTIGYWFGRVNEKIIGICEEENSKALTNHVVTDSFTGQKTETVVPADYGSYH